MSNPFLSRPRRWPRLVIGAAGLLLLGVAAGLVVEQALVPPPPSPTGVPTPAQLFETATANPTAAPSRSLTPAGGIPSAGPLRLIRGRRLIAGVYVGYPHSTRGAVSAATEFMTQIGSTLDPDRSAAVLRLTTDPSYPDGPQQFAAGTVDARRSLGLPTTGPVSAGASVALTPTAYQVRDLAADQVTVLLLGTYTVMLPADSRTRFSVFPLRMHWAKGDWRILRPDSRADYSALVARPGSDDAAAKGWQVMQR